MLLIKTEQERDRAGKWGCVAVSLIHLLVVVTTITGGANLMVIAQTGFALPAYKDTGLTEVSPA
jgi:hypothetical protein